MLLNKLPPDIRLIVSRKVASSEQTMDSLLKAFQEELAARERASNSSPSQPRRNNDRGQHTPTSALLSKAPEPGAGITCCYCQKPHPSVSCTSVTSVSARKQILKTSGRCFNCLRKGHVGRNCRSSGRCQRCKGRHHTSICEMQGTEGASQPPPALSLAKPLDTTSTSLDPGAPLFTPTVSTNALSPDERKTVLLQTARSVVYNPSNPTASIEVRLLFDTGSQKSYITERARSLLSLEPCGEQPLSIATFGSAKKQMKVCPIVDVGMHLKNGSPRSFMLYVVPTICGPLVSQPITTCVEQKPKFLGLDIADCSDGASSLDVDLLIGSDYYWDLVTGNICRWWTNCRSHQVGLGFVRPSVRTRLCKVCDEPNHHTRASN